MLFYKAVFIQIIKNRLGYFGTFLVRSAAEFVKGNVEPVVNILVDLVIIVAKLAWSFFVLQGFCFSCSSVFVSSANIHRFVTA